LERQHIQTLAKIELQEELENEAEECAVVKKLADASGLDGVEDVEMRSDDLDGDVIRFVERSADRLIRVRQELI